MDSQIASIGSLPKWLTSLPDLDIERLVDTLFGVVQKKDITGVLNFWNTTACRLDPFILAPLLRGAVARLAWIRYHDIYRPVPYKPVPFPPVDDITLSFFPEYGPVAIYGIANIHVCSVELHNFVAALKIKEKSYFKPSISNTLIPAYPSTYIYYATIVELYGTPDAQKSLRNGEVILLGLRKHTWTLANKGRGLYDDQIIVLKGLKPARSVHRFPACTEPGSQYSERSKAPKADSPYAKDKVTYNKTFGVDINKDGIKDLGRLVEGTYEYFELKGGYTHTSNKNHRRAFTVKTTQVTERDTDGDGYFTEKDPSRIDKTGAGTSMLIHVGGVSNTYSAGCQTIPSNRYKEFLDAVGNPTSFYYVLVNTR